MKWEITIYHKDEQKPSLRILRSFLAHVISIGYS